MGRNFDAGRAARSGRRLVGRLDERAHAAGELGEDAGFTLIELMVVLLILAILLAIAIPTFLGVTNSANDRATQSNLNTALVNAKAAYQTNGQSYTGITLSDPNLTFTTGAPATDANSTISYFGSSDGNGIVLSDFSPKTKTCWIIVDNSQAVGTGSATTYTNATSAGTAPVAAGTQYGTIANTTASVCNAGGALTGATYKSAW